MAIIKNPISIVGTSQSSALSDLIGGDYGSVNIVASDLLGVSVVKTNAFYYNNTLCSIELPETVEQIEEYAFYGCVYLVEVTIPSSIEYIGDYAFQDCGGLDSITILATTPPSLGSGVFTYTGNCPIYVPAGSVSDYQNDSDWSQYASRIEAIPT